MFFVILNIKETYCDVLIKYKSDLARPFEEATVFLKDIETQLHSLCNNDASRIITHASGSGRSSILSQVLLDRFISYPSSTEYIHMMREAPVSMRCEYLYCRTSRL